MAPFMVYLLLLGLQDLGPFQVEWRWLAILIRGVGALAVVALFRRHLPPWGRPHWGIAIAAGLVCAAGWVAGQHFFDSLGIPHRLPIPPFAGTFEVVDPHTRWGDGALWWVTATMRITVACTTVPIVEELFWRAFLLRALINWQDFDRIPLGTFTWWSFLGTSLLSALQHPDNWLVSVFCWFAFNGLFYWTRSILCLVLVHACTNLALYVYVIAARDWMFW